MKFLIVAVALIIFIAIGLFFSQEQLVNKIDSVKQRAETVHLQLLLNTWKDEYMRECEEGDVSREEFLNQKKLKEIKDKWKKNVAIDFSKTEGFILTSLGVDGIYGTLDDIVEKSYFTCSSSDMI